MVLKLKVDGKNKIAAINTWAVTVFRYEAGILQWKESKLKDVDRKSRKTTAKYGVLYPNSDVDRLYINRKEGGRGLMSVEYCVREEENSVGFYVTSSKENLNRGVAAAETTIKENQTILPINKRPDNLKQNWSEKEMYRQFIREMLEKVNKDKTWQWLSKSDLKIGTSVVTCCTGTSQYDKLCKAPH